MAKYSYITDKTHNNRKIQVESAKRDGSGKNIENNYAKQNGNYQSLTAGLSNNFDTKKVMVDESAYNFRPTATMGSVELEVGSPCKVKKIIGGSVAFNQKITNGNFENTNGWYITGYTTTNVFNVSNNVAHVEYDSKYSMGGLVQGTGGFGGYAVNHKFLLSATIKNLADSTALFRIGQAYGVAVFSYIGSNETKKVEGVRIVSTISGQGYDSFIVQGGQTNVLYSFDVKNAQCFDLTQMFGSTIADYIYSLEQANAGSGVAWFKRYFPKEYYAYNSGEPVSVKTQGKKITHFNQWDEEWELGYWNSITGGKEYATNRIRCKNFIKVKANTTYYLRNVTSGSTVIYYNSNKERIGANELPVTGTHLFVTPSNCCFIKFNPYTAYGSTYNHDICINFHYDGERDGEYEPYNSETYPCDDIELRGIPQLDDGNNLAFDGDEYASSGNVTRKYGTYTFTGNESWDASANGYMSNITGLSNLVKKANANSDVFTWQINNAGLKATSGNELYTGRDTSGIAVITNGNIFIGSDDYANRSNLVGKTIIFELATPKDENSIPFTEVQECDNWGTEEWLAPTTDTRPCEVPVGHETDYLPDLKAKVEVAPNTPNENGVYVMEHNASGNSYTPIATWLTDNGYAKADTLPTKDSVGGTLRQTMCLKDNILFENSLFIDFGDFTYSIITRGVKKIMAIYNVPNIASTGTYKSTGLLSTKYSISSQQDLSNIEDKHIMQNGDNVFIYDSDYTDATTFKNAMKGVLLAYEKAS